MSASIETLEFQGQPAVRFATANGASAIVSLMGAQILSWIPAGGVERLYLSPNAVHDGHTPVRGGIPVCFPQFANLGPLPKHGLLRTLPWQLVEQRAGDTYAHATLRITDSDATRALWPARFAAEITVAIDSNRLDVEFEVENRGEVDFSFTAALHTYLRVHEVENARLEGLHGCTYRDAANADRLVRETGESVSISAETDRVYRAATRPLLLRDSGRNIAIKTEGFPDVVVWNPWEERCAQLPDMPANGFRHMLCVEAAVEAHPVELAPGREWFGRQTLVAI